MIFFFLIKILAKIQILIHNSPRAIHNWQLFFISFQIMN